MITKACTKCKEIKPLEAFSINKGNKYNRHCICKKCRCEHFRLLRIKNKDVVFSHYSFGKPECTCCGEKEMKFLCIDHINNDGALHRKNYGRVGHRIYTWLKNKGYPEGYQVLCFNCNNAKALYGECPHKKKGA